MIPLITTQITLHTHLLPLLTKVHLCNCSDQFSSHEDQTYNLKLLSTLPLLTGQQITQCSSPSLPSRNQVKWFLVRYEGQPHSKILLVSCFILIINQRVFMFYPYLFLYKKNLPFK